MIQIINTVTGEVVTTIITNNYMTIEDMLELAGAEPIPYEDGVETADYVLNGKEIFVEDLVTKTI